MKKVRTASCVAIVLALANLPSISAGTCGVSNLGYQCWLQVCPSIAMHWTLGGPAPSECWFLQGSGNASWDASATVVHFALVTDLDGWVSMSLPSKAGVMVPADSIIAVAPTGGPLALRGVNPFFLKDKLAPRQVDEGVHLTDTQVSYNASTRRLTACFSRPTAALGSAGISLDLTSPALAMNFAASPASSPANEVLDIHAFDKPHLCGALVSLLATSKPGGEGSITGARDTRNAVIAHGILMILAWLVFLPTGVLMARHRWIFPVAPPSPPSPSAGLPDKASQHNKPKLAMWFILHRFLQLSGLAIFSAGFLLPWVAFGNGHEGAEESSAMQAHSTIGIIVAVLAYSQFVLVFIRPKPDSPRRHYWNLQHWWTGRMAVILAIVQIFIGVKVFQETFESKAPWIAAVVLLLVIQSLVIGGLEVRSGFWSSCCGFALGGGAWQQLPLQEPHRPQVSSSKVLEDGLGGSGGGGSDPTLPLSTVSQVMHMRGDFPEDSAPLLGKTHHRNGAGNQDSS